MEWVQIVHHQTDQPIAGSALHEWTLPVWAVTGNTAIAIGVADLPGGQTVAS